MEKIENHIELAKESLTPYISSFKQIKNMAGLSGERAQYVENALWNILYSLDIEQAYGVWLDYIGKEVGVNRTFYTSPDDALTFSGTSDQGFGAGKFYGAGSGNNTKNERTDFSFRNAIKAKIIQNSTDCSVDELKKALKLLYNASVISVTESYPAGISEINVRGSNLFQENNAVNNIKKLLACCVSLDTVNFITQSNLFKNDAFISYDSYKIPEADSFTLEFKIFPDSIPSDETPVLSQASLNSDSDSLIITFDSTNGVKFSLATEYFTDENGNKFVDESDNAYISSPPVNIKGGIILPLENNTIKVIRSGKFSFKLYVNGEEFYSAPVQNLIDTIKSNVSDIDNIKGLYIFDQSSGTTIPDLSGNGHNIILSQDASTLSPDGKEVDLGYGNGDYWDVGTVIASGINIYHAYQLQNGSWIASDYTNGYVYTSPDRITWTRGSLVVANVGNRRFLQLPNGNLCLTNTTNGRLYKSTDNGVTWDAGILIATGLVGIILLNDGITVMVNTSSRIYKSTDNCASFPIYTTVATTGIILQLQNGTILGTNYTGNKIYKSTDNGATWDSGVDISTQGIWNGLSLLETSPNEVIIACGIVSVGGRAYVSRSTDGGVTWSTPKLAPATISSFSKDNLGKIYFTSLSSGTGIYQSLATWTIPDNDDMSFVEYGSELITNGNFDTDTTGWTASNATLASVSGGQSGNCLQITNSTTIAGYAYQSLTTVIGKAYEITAYTKKGTATCNVYAKASTPTGTTLGTITGTTSTTGFVKSILIFVATSTTTVIVPAIMTTASGDYCYCDQVSVKEVTEKPFTLMMFGSLNNSVSQSLIRKHSIVTGAINAEYSLYSGATSILAINSNNISNTGTIGRSVLLDNSDVGSNNLYSSTYSGNKTNSSFKIYKNSNQIDTANSSSGTYLGMSNGTADIGNYYKNASDVKSSIGSYKPSFIAIINEELTPTQIENISNALTLYETEAIANQNILINQIAQLFIGYAPTNFYNLGSIYDVFLTNDTTNQIILNDSLKSGTLGYNNGVKFI